MEHLIKHGLSLDKWDRCYGCESCKPIPTNDGFEFYGCVYGENKGKFICEIIKCPLKKYLFSLNDKEYFNGDICNSRKEAIQGVINAAKEYEVVTGTAYIGVAVPYEYEIDANLVIEDAIQQAMDEDYEIEDYLEYIDNDDIDDLQKLLQGAWNKWMNKHEEYKPNFYKAEKIEKFNIEKLLAEGFEEVEE